MSPSATIYPMRFALTVILAAVSSSACAADILGRVIDRPGHSTVRIREVPRQVANQAERQGLTVQVIRLGNRRYLVRIGDWQSYAMDTALLEERIRNRVITQGQIYRGDGPRSGMSPLDLRALQRQTPPGERVLEYETVPFGVLTFTAPDHATIRKLRRSERLSNDDPGKLRLIDEVLAEAHQRLIWRPWKEIWLDAVRAIPNYEAWDAFAEPRARAQYLSAGSPGKVQAMAARWPLTTSGRTAAWVHFRWLLSSGKISRANSMIPWIAKERHAECQALLEAYAAARSD